VLVSNSKSALTPGKCRQRTGAQITPHKEGGILFKLPVLTSMAILKPPGPSNKATKALQETQTTAATSQNSSLGFTLSNKVVFIQHRHMPLTPNNRNYLPWGSKGPTHIKHSPMPMPPTASSSSLIKRRHTASPPTASSRVPIRSQNTVINHRHPHSELGIHFQLIQAPPRHQRPHCHALTQSLRLLAMADVLTADIFRIVVCVNAHPQHTSSCLNGYAFCGTGKSTLLVSQTLTIFNMLHSHLFMTLPLVNNILVHPTV